VPLEFAQRIRRIPVYPAASGYDLGAETAMLASNESCFAPLPEVVEAARRALAGAHRYPDPSYSALRRALADRYGLAPERIALGNGSADLLLAAGEALLEPGAEVVYAWPSFSVYPHLAAASGARAIEVPLDAEERHDLDALAREITVATRLVLLCNPNNPTSTALGLDRVEAFLERVPAHVCVILDEAYCEFSLALGDPYASLELLRRHSNLVLLRTFSKVYGLAALRVGYALCGSDEFRVAVDQVRQPFYLGAAAQAAAAEALRHQDEVERRVARTLAARLSVEDGLRRLGLWAAESDANFVWLRLPEETVESEVVAGLAARGVLVRAGTSLGREGALRVTVGSEPENQRFLAALGELLSAPLADGLHSART
jgi:histidinol-phosphate aminotransferase